MSLAPVLRSNDPAYQPDPGERPLYLPLRYSADFAESAVRAARQHDTEAIGYEAGQITLPPVLHDVREVDDDPNWPDTIPVMHEQMPRIDAVAEHQDNDRRSMRMLVLVLMMAFAVCIAGVALYVKFTVAR